MDSENRAERGHELVDHTADVALRAWAPSPGEVFEEAAAALCSLICDPATIELATAREIAVEAADPELLLAAWLNELIYRFEVERLVFARFDVLDLADTRLQARVAGEPLDPERHVVFGGVKAATLHQLSLRRVAAGWEAFVILDV